MSNKNKKLPKPRNWDVVHMIVGLKGGPHSDKRNKRGKKDRQWRNELNDFLD